MLEGGGLGDAQHRVHVLDRLARGALDQIVEGRDEDRSVRHTVARQADQTQIDPSDMALSPFLGETYSSMSGCYRWLTLMRPA